MCQRNTVLPQAAALGSCPWSRVRFNGPSLKVLPELAEARSILTTGKRRRQSNFPTTMTRGRAVDVFVGWHEMCDPVFLWCHSLAEPIAFLCAIGSVREVFVGHDFIVTTMVDIVVRRRRIVARFCARTASIVSCLASRNFRGQGFCLVFCFKIRFHLTPPHVFLVARRSIGIDGSFGKIVCTSTSYFLSAAFQVHDIYQLTNDECAPTNPCLRSKPL